MRDDDNLTIDQAGERLLSVADICTLLGLGRTAVFARITRGELPAPDFRFSARTTRWRRATIEAWMNTHAAGGRRRARSAGSKGK